MTAETIHTCSYYCERPECVRRQRDELRGRLEAATAEKDAEIDALRTRLEDTVRDSTNKIEALRAEVAEWKRVAAAQAELQDEAETRAERLAEALREVMLWIENWSPPFTEDDEWPDTEAKAQAALHPTAAQENDDA